VTFDFDDYTQASNRLTRLHELKDLNPLFRCTVFAIPGLGDDDFWASTPRWIELAVHGWLHPDSYECSNWGRTQIEELLDREVVRTHFVNGFKAPGWQISDDCYAVLAERGWWVADQHLEDGRRPEELRTYFYEDGGWHGHITDVCGNGIEETWPQLCEAVTGCTEFRFASEAVT
jgi:hypothetical protein